MSQPRHTTKQFSEALRELVAANGYTNRTGNVNWHAFARDLDGIQYESLRKVLAGLRQATPGVMEAAAAVVSVNPDYFVEYRLHQVRSHFDISKVGFEEAMKSLKRAEAAAITPKN